MLQCQIMSAQPVFLVLMRNDGIDPVAQSGSGEGTRTPFPQEQFRVQAAGIDGDPFQQAASLPVAGDECPPPAVTFQIPRAVKAIGNAKLFHPEGAVLIQRDLVAAREILGVIGGVRRRGVEHRVRVARPCAVGNR